MKPFSFVLTVALLCFFSFTVYADDEPRQVLRIPMSLLTQVPASRPVQVASCGNGPKCVPFYRLEGGIDQASVEEAVKFLGDAKALNPTAVVIELNTPGGSVDEGFHLIQAIEELEVPVYCVGDNQVASEGFALMQACTHRLATRRTRLMTHTPYLTGIFSGLTIEDLENHLHSLRAIAESFAGHCSKRMKISRAAYDTKVSGGKDWHMSAGEAVTVGALDNLVVNAVSVMKSLRGIR